MSVATSTDLFWTEPPPLVLRSSEGVLLGEWPCTFTAWHRGQAIGQGWSAWVYTLVDEFDRVAYVGQTHSLPKRLQQHARTKRFAWWYAFGSNDHLRDEAVHIELSRPYLFNDGRERRGSWDARVIRRTEILDGGR